MSDSRLDIVAETGTVAGKVLKPATADLKLTIYGLFVIFYELLKTCRLLVLGRANL
jgi:hypothetical protein